MITAPMTTMTIRCIILLFQFDSIGLQLQLNYLLAWKNQQTRVRTWELSPVQLVVDWLCCKQAKTRLCDLSLLFSHTTWRTVDTRTSFDYSWYAKRRNDKTTQNDPSIYQAYLISMLTILMSSYGLSALFVFTSQWLFFWKIIMTYFTCKIT